jgi:hypothetical protein
VRGLRSPAISASIIARPETPIRSVATVDNFRRAFLNLNDHEIECSGAVVGAAG